MMVFVKRYPNGTEISQLVSRLRQLHIAITFIASSTPSGGYHPETLYSLATNTNGFCAFNQDNLSNLSIEELIDTVVNPYLVYAANPTVSGSQTVLLPQMVINKTRNYMVSLTIQDYGPVDVVNTVMLQWKDNVYKTGGELGLRNGSAPETFSWWYGSNIGYWEPFDNIVYNMSVICDYKDTKTRRLQIRLYSEDAFDIYRWMPFDD